MTSDDPSIAHRLTTWAYEGVVHVAPVGRGVTLCDARRTTLDEAVEETTERALGRAVSGDYVHVRLRVEVLGSAEHPGPSGSGNTLDDAKDT